MGIDFWGQRSQVLGRGPHHSERQAACLRVISRGPQHSQAICLSVHISNTLHQAAELSLGYGAGEEAQCPCYLWRDNFGVLSVWVPRV